jgi:8-oxo-dGTP pyrophosphatase MutT (NUDIX family)
MAANPLQKLYTRQNICSNCGTMGHHFKHCIEPVTSYGIIAFRINDTNWNQAQRLVNDELTGIPDKNLEFLLIQRRDSIGFIELLRAKYKTTDIAYIKEQILGTTQKERESILNKSFDELWVDLWGSMTTNENKQHRQEYEQAKIKFEQLTHGVEVNGEIIKLETLLKSLPVQWNTPEWGFPKGRRNVYETDYKCALREFCEETGIEESDIKIFENIEPIRETFFGNNNIHYCHVYYLAWIPSRVKVNLKKENELMNREIGNIGWFSLNQALETIRSTNVEKREVLLRASLLLRNLCPIFVGPIVQTAEQVVQNEALLVNRSSANEQSTETETNPWIRQRHGKRPVRKFSFVDE